MRKVLTALAILGVAASLTACKVTYNDPPPPGKTFGSSMLDRAFGGH